MTPKPILKLAAGFAVLAILCGVVESLFFGGRSDANSVSLFLPLTFIFAAMAVTAVVFAILRIFLK